MKDIILYPTETLYGLGVHAFDREALDALFELKGRDSSKAATWLVRSVDDIRTYAELSPVAAKIAERFLPGALTLVLPTKEEIPTEVTAGDGTIGFRISSDEISQKVIEAYMEENNAPLTCTSANLSGSPAFPTVDEILQQFGEHANLITQVVDDGPRKGLASTVVKVVGDEVIVIREGEISEADIMDVVKYG